jgi:hypothetical protein
MMILMMIIKEDWKIQDSKIMEDPSFFAVLRRNRASFSMFVFQPPLLPGE